MTVTRTHAKTISCSQLISDSLAFVTFLARNWRSWLLRVRRTAAVNGCGSRLHPDLGLYQLGVGTGLVEALMPQLPAERLVAITHTFRHIF